MIFFWLWKDFGRGEAEIFDFVVILERFWKAWGRNLGFRFWKDFAPNPHSLRGFVEGPWMFGQRKKRIPIVFAHFLRFLAIVSTVIPYEIVASPGII